jgi:heme O synthase-like polyprenyltransferase
MTKARLISLLLFAAMLAMMLARHRVPGGGAGPSFW